MTTPHPTKSSWIAWTCDACAQSIHPDDPGHVAVSFKVVEAVETAWTAHEAAHPLGSWVELGDLLALPNRAEWRVMHDRCDSVDPDDVGDYVIPMHQLQTHRALIYWTTHLASKTWLRFTNWHAFAERVSR